MPFSVLSETDRAQWARWLAAAGELSCEDTPVDLGKAHASAAFLSVDDVREQCDQECFQPLRSLVRSIRSDGTRVYPLAADDVTCLSELLERALDGITAPLEPVWGRDGAVTMRRWRGADPVQALTRALKDRCL